MSVRILQTRQGQSVMYCSTTMWAFGPVFEEGQDPEAFLEWLKIDPRSLSDKELEARHYDWLKSLSPDEAYEICAYCGASDHVREECPQVRQEMLDRIRDETMENSRIEGPIASAIDAHRM